jgi:hypothetical protein
MGASDGNENAAMQECVEKLKELSGKSHVLLTGRGNVSIRLALKLAKEHGRNRLLLQDQGGWLTYEQFATKERFEFVELKSDSGVLTPKIIEACKDLTHCALLVNSMPGYSALLDMKAIAEVCKRHNIFLINDASGSIGTPQAMQGDIVLGSFGIDKPVNAGAGGFIATSDEDDFRFLSENSKSSILDYRRISERLSGLDERLKKLSAIKKSMMTLLNKEGFSDKIIDKGRDGINIIVRFDQEFEREKLIKLCEKEALEHTLCPRKIRVNERAVSIEIKRRQ